MKISAKNIFNNGVMVSLRTSCWGATGKLESNKFEVLNSDIDKEKLVKASITLLDDTTLIENMKKVRQKAKLFIESISIPFLVRKLKNLENDFALNHPELYNPNKYPSESELQSKISFSFVFRVFTPPDEDILSTALYKKEFKKFKEDIQTMKESTFNLIQQEMLTKFRSLNEQIKTEDKFLHKSTLKGVKTLLEKFDNIYFDFVDNKTLKKGLKELKKAFDGLDIDDNRTEGFKAEIKTLIDKTTKDLKTDKLFRALDF